MGPRATACIAIIAPFATDWDIQQLSANCNAEMEG